jgi:tetratricopeptide (TPR) repeat protein
LVWAELNLAAMISERAKLAKSPDAGLMARAIDGYRKVLDDFGSRPAGGQERDVYDAALVNTCDAQITMGRLQEALASCSSITELHPDSAVAFYNLAGVLAPLGRHGEALAALEKDLELGDVAADYLRADPWFTDLRTDPRFLAILDAMKRKQKKAPGP